MYNVPVVFPALRREESLLQIADSLGYLDQVFSDVHNRINGKVAEQSKALAGLNERILVAAAKVEKLKENKNKATNVFSVSKYPAEGNGTDLSVLFQCTQSHDLENANHTKQGLNLARFYVPSEKDLNALHIHATSTMDQMDRELRHHKKRKPRKSSGKEAADGAEGEDDLKKKCRLSKTVDSVSSLLVFDNNDLVDQVAQRRGKKKVEEDTQQLDDAPTSILTGEQLDQITAKNYLYVPGVAAVPEFDVPLSLPYLPDIATDVAYSAELPSIAPSAGIPELPAIQTAGESTATVSTAPASSTPPPPPPPDSAQPAAAPPPPPPPAPDSAAGGQAPGPPPPMPAPSPSEGSGSAPPLPSNDGSGRGDLLASIRNAGGGNMKLKSAKERKLEKKKKEGDDASTTCSAGGLFAIAALQAKLRMRREGISGKKRRGEDGDDADNSSSANVKSMDDDEDWK